MKSFSRRVRFGQSTSPFRRGFTLEEWQSSFEECDEPAVHDKNLYESGEHFHQRLTTLWEVYDQLSLSEIDAVRLRRGIVAAINREHVVLADRLREEMLRNARDGIIVMEETAGARIKLDHTEAEYNIEDLVGSMVDGALLPLRKSFEMSHNQRKKPELHQIRGISLLGQLHFVLLLNWENCSWRGYIAKRNGSIVTFQPTNEQEARHNAIALSRYYARVSEAFLCRKFACPFEKA